MATHRMPVQLSVPGSSDVFFDSSVNRDSNDRFAHELIVFRDTATKIGIGGQFVVPKNYVGTPKIILIWRANATTGNVVWDFDYRAIANAESLDPSTDQEAATVTTGTSATAHNRQESAIALTAANLAADDIVLFNLSRDGAASDTMAADALVEEVLFEWADA